MIFAIICLLIPQLNSCKDDVAQAGSSSLSEGEDVIVCSDTLGQITSRTIMGTPIYSTPDSFLLGECKTQDYGTLKAEILTQFSAPLGWTYPDSSALDSVCLYVYFDSWFGDGNAPMSITAYELDAEPLCYDSAYKSNTPVSRFCSQDMSKNIVVSDVVFTPAHPMDSIYSSTEKKHVGYERLRLTDEYANRIFSIRDFSSQKAFNNQFQGILLTSTYGASAALYVSAVCLTIHYHYTFKEGTIFKTMTDSKILYSNTEVKQFGRYEYTDHAGVYEKLRKDSAINYILSPANAYCSLSIPTQDIIGHVKSKLGTRRAYINLAQLRLDVLNATSKKTKDDNWAAPAKMMMMVNEDEFDKVFKYGKLPTDTTAVFASLTSEYDTISKSYQYFYAFDLSTPFTKMLHEEHYADTIKLRLVPVDLNYTTTSSTTYISSIRLKQSVTATMIRSSFATETPLDIEVVYSGFTDSHIRH